MPAKAELPAYVQNADADLEKFIEVLETQYSTFENVDEERTKKIQNVRLNLIVFLTHDSRQLGLMECLKGLQTGFGSATKKRK